MRSSKRQQKLCLVSSSGGHLVKMARLRPFWGKYDRFWVVRNDLVTKSILTEEKKYYGYFPENRQGLNMLKNCFLAWKILKIERPTVVITMGAGIGPPFIWAAKLLGIKTIFIETFIFIPRPTLSGKLTYHIADDFIVQNRELLRVYPKAGYWGSVL